MKRSFSNRIFGGVCGGLANTTPLNAWLWRILFIVLTIASMGAAAAAYILLWWVWPLDSPIRRSTGGGLVGFLVFLLGVALIVAWFLRGRFGLTENYWIFAALLLTGIFLLKQIFTRRWQNILLGLAAFLIPLVFLLQSYEMLQGGLADIALRSWPAFLVFLGLSIVLRYRIQFGSVIAAIISVGLVAGMSYYAFNSRVDAPADNNRVTIIVPNEDDHDSVEISENVTTLSVVIRTQDTDVTISVGEDDRVLRGEFVGSNNSDVQIDYIENSPSAAIEISENFVSEFPSLEDMGRGNLTLQIPPDIAVGITFAGQRVQTLNFDLAALNLEQLNLQLDEGDAFIVLPEYQALSPSVQELNGLWTVANGALRVEVPETVGAQFFLERGVNREPNAGSTYDSDLYEVRLQPSDYILESLGFDEQAIKMRYRINVPSGRLQIESGG